MRLDRKLFWSYIAIVLVAISTSFTLFTVTSNQLLTYRIMDSMEKELELIENTLKNHSGEYFSIVHSIRNNIMKLVDSEFIIVKDNELLYLPSDIDEDLINHLYDYTYLDKRYLVVSKQINIGYSKYDIILLSDKGMITELNQLNLSILFITSLVSMLIAAFFGVYVQNNISRPIHLLRNKVRSFQD
ncbi:MAG: sensor histidine kinase, partial [Turicibacter sp.]|nr:sensor histidine kinase [Turicibacter sp.]